ncbi:MAG: Mor transcription activator family protein [Kiritimatiellia bacterium]
MSCNIDKNRFSIAKMPDEYLPDLSELNEDMRMIAEEFGVRAALRLCEMFAGTDLRLQGHVKWVRAWRNAAICKDFDENKISMRALARKYGLGQRWIVTILNRVPDQDDRALPPGLF